MQRSLVEPLEKLYKDLHATEQGLSSSEANKRFEKVGPNEAIEKESHPILKDVLYFCSNPLVIILLLAAAVSGTLGGVVDATIIVVMVLLSVIMNVAQTYRSRIAVTQLQNSLAPTATILRDGKWTEFPRRNVVPGDIVRISAGDVVPADCRLVTAVDLHAQQSALTGESLPVDKHVSVDKLNDESPVDSESLVFLGTSVVSGVGDALVVNTGKFTMFGDIAQRLAVKAPETEFESGVRKFGMLILKTVIFLVLFVFLSSIVLKRNPLESLLFSVAGREEDAAASTAARAR